MYDRILNTPAFRASFHVVFWPNVFLNMNMNILWIISIFWQWFFKAHTALLPGIFDMLRWLPFLNISSQKGYFFIEFSSSNWLLYLYSFFVPWKLRVFFLHTAFPTGFDFHDHRLCVAQTFSAIVICVLDMFISIGLRILTGKKHTPAFTKSMNMDIWVVDTSNELFIRGF